MGSGAVARPWGARVDPLDGTLRFLTGACMLGFPAHLANALPREVYEGGGPLFGLARVEAP